MKKKFIIIPILLLTSLIVNGQRKEGLFIIGNDVIDVADSIGSTYPSLSSNYYQYSRLLRHNYNYDLIDKKRKLEMKSKDLRGASIIAVMASTASMVLIGESNDWSLAVSLPSAFALAAATSFPLFLLSERVKKKSERMDTQSALIVNVNNHAQIGITKFSYDNGFGICVNTCF
jgi:hypothetical protein